MNSPLIQLLVLAGIAIFLILRLKSVLGSREGFEKPRAPVRSDTGTRPELEVIEGGSDRDIVDYVAEESRMAQDLAAMKRVEPEFSVTDFVHGARAAYEMIITGFERGELDAIQPFLGEDVYDAFVNGVAAREDQGLVIESHFIGVGETAIQAVSFDRDTNLAEISMRFAAELTSIVRDRSGNVIEGSPTDIKHQKDRWTFARTMGSDDLNWLLVATDI